MGAGSHLPRGWAFWRPRLHPQRQDWICRALCPHTLQAGHRGSDTPCPTSRTLRWRVQDLNSSLAEPTGPSAPSGRFLLAAPQNLWASPCECGALGVSPEAVFNNASQGVPSAAVRPRLIQSLPWTEGMKVRAVMSHPGDSPWDPL